MSLTTYLSHLQKENNLTLKELSEKSDIPLRTLNRLKNDGTANISNKTIGKLSDFENITPVEVMYKILYDEEFIDSCSENSLLYLSEKSLYEKIRVEVSKKFSRYSFDGYYVDTINGRIHGLVDSWENLEKQFLSEYFDNKLNKENIIKVFKNDSAYINSVISFGINKILFTQMPDKKIKFYDIIFDSSHKNEIHIASGKEYFNCSFELNIYSNQVPDKLLYRNLCPKFIINELKDMLKFFFFKEKLRQLDINDDDLIQIKLELYRTSKILAESIIQLDKNVSEGLNLFNIEYHLDSKGLVKPSLYNYKKVLLQYIDEKINDLENGIDDNEKLYANTHPIYLILDHYQNDISSKLCSILSNSLNYTFNTYEKLKKEI